MGEANVDLIEEGYDLALRMIAPPDSSLIVRSLATWRHVLCCSHYYIEAHGRVQTLEELAGHNCVRHINYPFDEWRFFDRKGTPASVRMSGKLITNSGEALRRRCCRVRASVWRPDSWCGDDLDAGRLVRLLPEYRPVEMSMNAVYPHKHHLSAKVRTFIDMLVQHSAEQQKLINPYS